MPYEEKDRALLGNKKSNYYAEDLKKSGQLRAEYKKRMGVVKAEDMPWENSPQGRIKHMVHEKMNTRECCVEEYQQLLSPGGRSGKHRHMAEEILYILEGKGYDLHWDVQFDCKDEYSWSWAENPRRFDWKEGDMVYIPPFTTHQHYNADEKKSARFISAQNRIVKAMGFDWLDQIENAPDYKP